MKKILIAVFIIFIIFPEEKGFSMAVSSRPPSIDSGYAVVMDGESGRILYEKNSCTLVPMASTTKIMTAIVALENSKLDEIVIPSKRACSVRGSVVGLKEGQEVTMEELLYGLMLESGNDCAIAIAEHVGKSVEGFACMMDSKAFDIGAFNTCFRTPHGLDANGHFTTAYDLALITRYAFKNDLFAKIVSTKEITFDTDGRRRSFHNINKMLWIMEGADGVKTGYTGKAGKCLVSSVMRQGRRFICVVLNSRNRWEDSKKLLDYSFKTYTEEFSIDAGNYNCNIGIETGIKHSTKAGLDGNISVPLSSEEKKDLYYKIILPDSLPAPVYSGQQAGRFVLYSNNAEIYSMPFRILYGVEKSETKSFFKKLFYKEQID